MYWSLHHARYCPLRAVPRSINRARTTLRRRRYGGAGGATAPDLDYRSTPTSLRSSPPAGRTLRHRPRLEPEHRTRGQSCDRRNRRRTFRCSRAARWACRFARLAPDYRLIFTTDWRRPTSCV
uniref:Uncharacterized protein n=1 Tax=Rhodococcus sp. T104 TaxID=230533 RepID=B6VJI5_9NOCA|nr:hypothetical protein [Rhodococcus sp. T104]